MSLERQTNAEKTCTYVAAQMLKEHAGKSHAELSDLLGRRWANLCLAAEGAARREAAERCADIAERWGDAQIRDDIREAFGLNNW